MRQSRRLLEKDIVLSTEPSRQGTELPPCPACAQQRIDDPVIYETSVHSEGETVGLSRCPDCQVYFTRPRLVRHNVSTREVDYETIRLKYSPEASENNFHKNGNYRLYLDLAEARLARVPREKPYRLLDIGSHCGFFLRFAQEAGWRVRGVEPSQPHVRFAREINGIEAIEQGFFDSEFDSKRYDLVTMFDVLEHIPEPIRLLSEIEKRLEPGGLVLCKVPHVRFYLTFRPLVIAMSRLGLLPKFPTFTSPPTNEHRGSTVPPLFDLFEHVVHYDRRAAQEILTAAGFTSFEILPAPPTNPRRHYLNAPRSLTYALANGLHRFGVPPNALTHGLILVGHKAS